MSNRRDFLKNAALLGAASFMGTSIPLVSAAEIKPADPRKKRALRFAHITDCHVMDKPECITSMKTVFEQINSLKDKPQFIINSGDTVMDSNNQTKEKLESHWNVWRKAVSHNKLPLHSCLGNHDVWYGPKEQDENYKKEARYGKAWAIEELKMPSRYYSFEQNGWKFIALDSMGLHYGLDEEQYQWLESELAASSGKNVCVYSHVPIMSFGALMYYVDEKKDLSEVSFPKGDMHSDIKKLKNLFFKHKNVKLCLSGHVHYIDETDYLGVKYLCNGAVSSNWWDGVLAEFPNVYAIIDLYTDGTCDCQLVYYNQA